MTTMINNNETNMTYSDLVKETVQLAKEMLYERLKELIEDELSFVMVLIPFERTGDYKKEKATLFERLTNQLKSDAPGAELHDHNFWRYNDEIWKACISFTEFEQKSHFLKKHGYVDREDVRRHEFSKYGQRCKTIIKDGVAFEEPLAD